MRIKTLVAISLAAVLAANVNASLRQSYLPVSQYQASANAPQKVKLELIMPETVVEIKAVKVDKVSRSSSRSSNIELNQSFAKSFMAVNYGGGVDQFNCLVPHWERESGWKETAHNSSSGAHGIPQSLPGNKMAEFGADWKTNPETQIKWGLAYIQGRYDTPCGAWKAFKNKGWY